MQWNTSERSQAYTLEGVFSAVIVLTALLYGLQVVDIGPWTSESSEQAATLETQAQDVLDLAAENGSLSRTARCYGLGQTAFSGATIDDQSTHFERLLNQTFDEQDRDYNVYLYYWDNTSGKERVLASFNRTRADSGIIAPSDSAAVATRTVTIYDDMPTPFGGDSERACEPSGASVKAVNADFRFYLDDIDPDSKLFNIVEVRIVVW